MRTAAAVGIGLTLLVGLALAASLQSRHDESVSAQRLLTAWRSVGGSLVEPTILAASTDTGLDCFAYQATDGPAESDLCFDSQGRLVEALRESPGAASLVSVSTSPDRSPVRVSASALAAAAKVVILDAAVRHLRDAVGRCGSTVMMVAHLLRSSGTTGTTVYYLFSSASRSCVEGARKARSEARWTAISARSSALVRTLVLIEDALARDASLASQPGLAITLASARTHLRLELRLRSAARAVIVALDAQARRERRRLATS